MQQLLHELHESTKRLKNLSGQIKEEEQFAKEEKDRMEAEFKAERHQDSKEKRNLKRAEERVTKANEYIRTVTALAYRAGVLAADDVGPEKKVVSLEGIKKVALALERAVQAKRNELGSRCLERASRIRRTGGLRRKPCHGKYHRMRILREQGKQARDIKALLQSMASCR